MWALLLFQTLFLYGQGPEYWRDGTGQRQKLLEGNDGSIELLSSTTGCTFRLLIPILEAP